MTAQLTRSRSNDSRTDDAATTETEPFPYGHAETGLALPIARSRGVLRSRDAAGAIGAAGSMTCPACDAETINGAGLFACTDCSWSGSLR